MSVAAENGQRQGPRELFQRMSLRMYDEARKEGLTLAQLLEREDPSEQHRDGTDAFQRQLREAGIVTRSDPYGAFRASTMEAWGANEHARALFPEWCFRTIDQVRLRGLSQQRDLEARKRELQALIQQRAPFLSDDTAIGTFLRPYADDTVPRWSDQTRPAIPLEEVVARTRFITGSDTARSTYITRDATQQRRKRVAEAASIPRAKLVTSANVIPTYKYGIALEASYEVMRRVPIDDFALFLQMEAIQSEIDKVAAALDIMVNGDGNANTAGTVYNLTTLDSTATVGTLTLAAWIAFKTLFVNPYVLTHILGNGGPIAQVLKLNFGSANILVSTRPDLGGLEPINNTLADSVRWGITADAPSNKIVGYYRPLAIGRVVESASIIQEMERWILSQVQILTATENEGFEVLDPKSIKILRLDA